MIFDRIENAGRYESLGTEIASALRFAKTLNSATKEGRYEWEGGIYANVMRAEAKPAENAVFETHRDYLDLQIVLEGAETVKIANPERLTIKTAYDESRDAAFYTGDGSDLIVRAGEFYLVYPTDAHAPTLYAGVQIVKKAVVKIPYREENE